MVKHFLIGVLCATTLAACAANSYKYYTLDLESYDKGHLRGPDPKKDLPISRCTPTEGNKSPCFVMLDTELERALADLARLRAKLRECERGCSALIP